MTRMNTDQDETGIESKGAEAQGNGNVTIHVSLSMLACIVVSIAFMIR